MSQIRLGVMALPGGAGRSPAEGWRISGSRPARYCWDNSCSPMRLPTGWAATAARLGIEITTLWTGAPWGAMSELHRRADDLRPVPSQEGRAEAGFRFRGVPASPSITTHVGFIPENPSDPTYGEVVAAPGRWRNIAGPTGRNSVRRARRPHLTLLRTIEDVATGNLGINLTRPTC